MTDDTLESLDAEATVSVELLALVQDLQRQHEHLRRDPAMLVRCLFGVGAQLGIDAALKPAQLRDLAGASINMARGLEGLPRGLAALFE